MTAARHAATLTRSYWDRPARPEEPVREIEDLADLEAIRTATEGYMRNLRRHQAPEGTPVERMTRPQRVAHELLRAVADGMFDACLDGDERECREAIQAWEEWTGR